jgi:Xaa-Pro aminopeptidase
MKNINNKINELRDRMKLLKLDAFIIPSSDPHQSEYVCDYWKVREYFSGFDGSAGTLVITQNEVALWTDSRYFLQVEQQCENSIVKLFKQTIPHAPEHIPWVCNELNKNSVIGLDYRQFSKSQIDYILSFAKPKNIAINNQPHLVDEIWTDRPALPSEMVEIHSIEFSGESTASKIQKVKDEMEKQQSDFYFLSTLDDIAWLFNIRSNDVDFTPLVVSYGLIGKEKSYIFCDSSRFNAKIKDVFNKLSVEIVNYDLIAEKLPELSSGKKIITDAASLNFACFDAIKGEIVFQQSKVQQLKTIKNTIEIENSKKCMLKDGIAMTKFFIWLDDELKVREISEYEIGQKLMSFRKELPLYRDDSFAAIVGYKGNGAIIHYTAPKEGSAMVKNEGILLIDSGAQYENGTTDVTRTVWLGGEPTQDIKTAFTSVLKSYIELDQMQFPKGTVGMQLDAFARMHMWKQGLNFPHGTGHGIGNYGMVHEPTQGFAASMTTTRGSVAHQPNQFTTIEPGCYKKDTFGIRIENVVVSKVKEITEFGEFYGFEALTVFPIETQLIDKNLMQQHEIDWLNAYHKKVFATISPKLKPSEKDWLAEKCKEI